MKKTPKLRPGDLVEVKAPDEILETLDSDGTLALLPFMPEMVEFCGKRFRVLRRVLKTCAYQSNSTMRVYATDDVVLLDSLRCSGEAHDGCQKACMIFWRESWLRRVEDGEVPVKVDDGGRDRLRGRLKTSTGPKTYFCQASEIYKATVPLSRGARLAKCFSDVRDGNCSALEMARRISVWVFWRVRKMLLGQYASGPNKLTPAGGLNLAAGDWVQVKSLGGINETLNQKGYNRGLYFSPDMGSLCGEWRRVERKLEKFIVDGTGEMRRVHNTVYLEDSPCGCAHVALGGCPRGEFSYWREIWLTRPSNGAQSSEPSRSQSNANGM
jgi:hypothetical protein